MSRLSASVAVQVCLRRGCDQTENDPFEDTNKNYLIFLKSLFLSPVSSGSPHPDSYREEDPQVTQITVHWGRMNEMQMQAVDQTN